MRKKFQSVKYFIPSAITGLALCMGMSAIQLAIYKNYRGAVCAILMSAALDMIDGRAARLLNSASRFGAELDSLADVINFGVAPGIVLYLWTMSTLPMVGWLSVLTFTGCCAFRLARFNSHIGSPASPEAEGFFVGVPAPAGAALALLPMYIDFECGVWIMHSPLIVMISLIGSGLLMVSTVPTFSFKKHRVSDHRPMAIAVTAGVTILGGVFYTRPWFIMAFAAILYLFSIPLAMRVTRRIANDAPL